MDKRTVSACFFLLIFSSTYIVAAKKSWSWLYKKRFSSLEMRKNKKKKEVTFEKTSIPLFSQLIFSWNAFRPEVGHFSFFIKVRDSKTKQWTKWLKMSDWGKNIQRSHFSSVKNGTKHVYVRLETGNKKSDAFVVKVVSNEGKNLDRFKGFSVCTVDFTKFHTEKNIESFYALPSVYIKSVPKKSQMILDHPRAGHMCSPTSCSMLTGYLLQKHVNPLDFAKNVFDEGLQAYGSWPFNTAHAFELCNGHAFFSVARLPSFKDLHTFLRRKIPVVVSVRGVLTGAPKTYDNGHLLLVVGWDKKRKQVVCHDPAMQTDKKILKRYDLKSFLRAWERSHRLSYLAERIV
ncbi:C39 family peptidase [bacterium]|nr:C39 family peptidase [bacterium]